MLSKWWGAMRQVTRSNAAVLEGQRLGLGVGGAHVGEAALFRFAFDHVEHFLGDVGRPDALDMRREGVGDMAAAGGDVEHAPVFLRRGQLDEALQALAEPVRRAGEVARGGLAELFLDEGFAHCLTSMARGGGKP